MTRFPDPASAPLGAATDVTVTDEETGTSGTTFTDADGRWVGCALGQVTEPDPTDFQPSTAPPA